MFGDRGMAWDFGTLNLCLSKVSCNENLMFAANVFHNLIFGARNNERCLPNSCNEERDNEPFGGLNDRPC